MNNINNPIDYRNDDASVELINNLNKKRREMELEQERLNNLAFEKAKAERAIANSVGNTVSRIMYDNERAKIIEKQRKNKIKATVGAFLVLCSLSTGLIIAHGDEIKTNHEVYTEINEQINEKTKLVINRKLAEKAEGNKPFTILENKVSEYGTLNVTSPNDVYTYMKIFGDNLEEFNKLIMSINYYDVNGQICYYTGFDDFLVRNGYSDVKDFEEKIKNTIKITLEDNIEQEFTYSESSVRKGGK